MTRITTVERAKAPGGGEEGARGAAAAGAPGKETEQTPSVFSPALVLAQQTVGDSSEQRRRSIATEEGVAAYRRAGDVSRPVATGEFALGNDPAAATMSLNIVV